MRQAFGSNQTLHAMEKTHFLLRPMRAAKSIFVSFGVESDSLRKRQIHTKKVAEPEFCFIQFVSGNGRGHDSISMCCVRTSYNTWREQRIRLRRTEDTNEMKWNICQNGDGECISIESF